MARIPDGWVFIPKVNSPKLEDGKLVATVNVDKRELVMCKNCKHFNMSYANHDGMCLASGDFMDYEDFCSMGERRD